LPAEPLLVCDLGLVEYREGVALQEEVRARRQAGELPDVLLLLEHPPVYTLGRRADPATDLPLGEAWYRAQGLDVVKTDRGGRLTYHGPGQLVGYPIMRIEDVIAYLRTMEGALIAALAGEGIEAQVREGLTGVWVQDRKIASIGVHVSRGVTTHGFAVNVVNDLAPFTWAVPCGLQGVRMTSVREETGREDLPGFRERVAAAFAEAYGRAPERVGRDALTGVAAATAVR
jgi:lipoyl(octanoyl) transferase